MEHSRGGIRGSKSSRTGEWRLPRSRKLSTKAPGDTKAQELRALLPPFHRPLGPLFRASWMRTVQGVADEEKGVGDHRILVEGVVGQHLDEDAVAERRAAEPHLRCRTNDGQELHRARARTGRTKGVWKVRGAHGGPHLAPVFRGFGRSDLDERGDLADILGAVEDLVRPASFEGHYGSNLAEGLDHLLVRPGRCRWAARGGTRGGNRVSENRNTGSFFLSEHVVTSDAET